MTKLILVEGIPGSGKSSTARKIKELLKARGIHAVCFNETDLHPCDLAWHACVPLSAYRELLNTFQEHESVLAKYTSVEGELAQVAYTQLGLEFDHPLIDKLMRCEPYNGKVSLAEFKALHFTRWENFGRQIHNDVTYIFECAYLQNHVNELILTYQQTHDSIVNYMKELIETVQSLSPFLIYLSPKDVSWTVSHAANTEERKAHHWLESFIAYLENSNYGKANRVTGFDGCVEFLEQRQDLELNIIAQLPIATYVREIQVDFKQPALEDDAKLVSMLLKN